MKNVIACSKKVQISHLLLFATLDKKIVLWDCYHCRSLVTTAQSWLDRRNAAKGAEESVNLYSNKVWVCLHAWPTLCCVGVCQTARDPLDLASSGLWCAHLVGLLYSFTKFTFYFQPLDHNQRAWFSPHRCHDLVQSVFLSPHRWYSRTHSIWLCDWHLLLTVAGSVWWAGLLLPLSELSHEPVHTSSWHHL